MIGPPPEALRLVDDSLVAEIFSTHEEYTSFGQPDTTDKTDNVV